jgi:SAM-dependent methyltransferase
MSVLGKFRRRSRLVQVDGSVYSPFANTGNTNRQPKFTAPAWLQAFFKPKYAVPAWFQAYFNPSKDAIKYWEDQLRLARKGRKHQLPDDRMRMPSSELHQLMAKSFIDELLSSSFSNFETILDIGCSDGYIVDYFNRHGKKATGIDGTIYPTDRLFIEENHLDVFEMDMHALDFDNESFDAVWCRHSLEHSFAPLQVLAEIHRVLKTNGLLFIILPPPAEPPVPYHGHWHQIPDYQLKYLLEMCNFEVLSLKTVHFSYKRDGDNLEIRAICKK